ncbi:MAG: LysM peptidoglycan-binding domain-containing protein [Oligoflexia bacterium]|nr:LysM peptidoglycan-binding domain-containing protein [Oligoflexia bacterium]
MNFFRYLPCLLSAILFSYLVACSSSPTSGDGGMDGGMSESSADAVGSIPEDMLDSVEAEDTSDLNEVLPMGLEDAASETASNETTEPAPLVADSGSSAEASDVADPFADLKESESESSYSSGSGEMATYTVRRGDTLMKIAFSIYGDIDRWRDLLELNRGKLSSAAKLRVGMALSYEAPLEAFYPNSLSNSYLIKQGDTLAGIADEVYGRKSKYRKLQGYNRKLIKNANRIFAGFTIYYDITPQEIAEAEARRRERSSASVGGSADDMSMLPSSNTPSVISPADSSHSDPAPIAISPDSSTVISPPVN